MLTFVHDHMRERGKLGEAPGAAEGRHACEDDLSAEVVTPSLDHRAGEAGIAVSTAPGASAVIAALSISGLPTDRFLFAGFLPSKARARSDAIAEIGNVKSTLFFYESGQRLGATLAALADQLSGREAVVARELTKKFEEVVSGTLPELAERYAEVIADSGINSRVEQRVWDDVVR